MISLMIHAEYEDSDHGTKKTYYIDGFCLQNSLL